MTGDAVADLVYAAFRLVSAGVLTISMAYVTYQWWREKLVPSPVWTYTVVVLWVVTLYRWIVVWIRLDGNEEIARYLVNWLQPITQSMAALLGMAILVLAIAHVRAVTLHRRAGDE